MPHFIIHLSQNLISSQTPEKVMEHIHDIAVESDLFNVDFIKVRILPFEHYLRAGKKQDFLNIFAEIMGGRTTEQKATLSKNMVAAMKNLFPDVPMAMSIRDIEKATYCNHNMV